MRPALASAAALALLITATRSGASQSAVGTVAGTIREQIASRSVRAATVSLVRLQSESDVTLSTRPDGDGRFRFDSLPAGRYLMQVSTPTLDSLDLALPARELTVSSGKTTRADLTLPFGSALRDVVCRSSHLGPGTVVLAGRVLEADTEQPIGGAQVIAAWSEVSVSEVTAKVSAKKRTAVARTGPAGDYRMCGIPAGSSLALQLRHEGRAGPVMRLTVSEDEGAAVRNLSMSTRSAPPIALLDSVERIRGSAAADSMPAGLEQSGTATVTGTVLGVGALPLASAQVRVRDARTSAVTDSAGRFVLGGLPSGTQILLVQRIGYALGESPVELRAGRTVEKNVLLIRQGMLDSMQVVASRTPYKEFDINRRTNGSGQFLTLAEIEQKERHVTETIDLFTDMLGFTALGHGPDARMVSNTGLQHPGCRSANVVVDGMHGFGINDVSPSQIGGIEAYANSAFVPDRYVGRADCGLVVIWLRKTPPPQARRAGLTENGYP